MKNAANLCDPPLLIVMDNDSCAEEEQGLKERMIHQVGNAAQVEQGIRLAEAHYDQADLRNRMIGKDLFEILLAQSESHTAQGGEQSQKKEKFIHKVKGEKGSDSQKGVQAALDQ